ncbi:hypothetical protein COLO4_31346 [Corchorus olitorius]|uniref:Uncharacterized protein n=1 Tax=Corchorus olitorius TaxID=93759 RepID=A0A1R3H4P0_9ROSI|nr:hypothetical protein COLO4_31346 [Corchorus olitorius]
MAVLSLCENDNKENIPPFSSKQPASVLTKPSSSIKKRRLRKPLEDITNLILPEIKLNLSLAQANTTIVVSSQPLVSQSKCLKRRAEDGLESVCKRTHLAYRSVNFR